MMHIFMEAAILSGEPAFIASSIQYVNLFFSVSSFDMKKNDKVSFMFVIFLFFK